MNAITASIFGRFVVKNRNINFDKNGLSFEFKNSLVSLKWQALVMPPQFNISFLGQIVTLKTTKQTYVLSMCAYSARVMKQSACEKLWVAANRSRLDTLLASIEKLSVNHYVRQSHIESFQRLIQQEFQRWFPWIKQSKALPIVTEKLQWLSHYARWQAQDIDDCRERYIARQLKVQQSFFDTVESNPLTLSQRRACIIDNDNNLLLAGAGTGKTSVMVGRTGYLLNSKQAQASDILLLAYGRKAADEMDDRLKAKLASTFETTAITSTGSKTNINQASKGIAASTFHSLGLQIIAQVEGAKSKLSRFAEDEKAKTQWLQTCFETLINEHATYRALIIEYFCQYYYVERHAADFKSLGEYYQYLTNNDVRSLKGDKVNSFGELTIANWLFMQGVEYQYRANYAVNVSTVERKQYQPDFFLPEHNIYIEYYALDESGEPPTFIDKKAYHEAIAWKRATHKKYQTRCIELSYFQHKSVQHKSDQHKSGQLITPLAGYFAEQNIVTTPLPDEAIIASLQESGRITQLVGLFSQLLGLYKAACLDTALEKQLVINAQHPKQTVKALVLLKPILHRYQAHLTQHGEIDFEDMINKALSYVQTGKFQSPWRYIMVDEFQDISEPRARLVKALRDNHKGSSIFAVGDDWQAIYRFSGADVSLTTHFARYFGATGAVNSSNSSSSANAVHSADSAHSAHSTTQSTLDTTFRFNNQIGKVASDFISKNPQQIKKKIHALQQVPAPAVSILKRANSVVNSVSSSTLSNNNVKTNTANTNTASTNTSHQQINELANGAIDDVLAAISAKVLVGQTAQAAKKSPDKKPSPASVYFLARFWFQLPSKADLERLKVKYPLLTLESQSFHASKGKEADYVVILGLKKGVQGFPSEKTTPALLDTLLAKPEAYAYAEERRLFYVALTRAKNRVYIIADISEASCFVKELIDQHADNITVDEFASEASQAFTDEINCLVCQTGILKKRSGKFGDFYACSHFPRCTHKEKPCTNCASPMTRQRFTGFKVCLNNRCNTLIPTCERCHAEMVLRASKNGKFWGCKNFKGNEPTSCKHSIDEANINWPTLV
ncbi:UvrD-helicase domain-containing protein [Cognaticolwellia aestuarii]|uniref:UvrD-helicase domain-containing protein n=1 Tax=Cognaticolwellia aestuarii TaxID=329993 RepID=UPI000987313D|nr:UvrD-helicase domain-containing protein [Cognaticolwellia aestuarii]